jgi:hypothetical protein
MPRDEILVLKVGDDWCVRCDGALFERMSTAGDALRVARAHAQARGPDAVIRRPLSRRPER